MDVELLSSDDPESPIGKFLARRGAGLHHVCYRVPDLDAAIGLATEWNGLLPGSTVEVRPLHQGEGM